MIDNIQFVINLVDHDSDKDLDIHELLETIRAAVGDKMTVVLTGMEIT